MLNSKRRDKDGGRLGTWTKSKRRDFGSSSINSKISSNKFTLLSAKRRFGMKLR